jgi:hypothetical protein
MDIEEHFHLPIYYNSKKDSCWLNKLKIQEIKLINKEIIK